MPRAEPAAVPIPETPPGPSDPLDNQAWFNFVREIAADLSHGRVVFPTSFETTLKLRELLRSDDAGAAEIERAVAADPLLSSKIVQVANSAAFSRGSASVCDIRAAIVRIGLHQVRNLATAVAMSQMVTYRQMLPYKDICQGMMAHCRRVAAVAAVLAREHSAQDSGKAYFAGLIHDIGVFYLLYRLSDRTEFFSNARELNALLHEWHGQIGHAVLATLDVPEDIQTAVADHDEPRAVRNVAQLADLIYVANLIAQLSRDGRAPIAGSSGDDLAAQVDQLDVYQATVASAENEIADLARAFA